MITPWILNSAGDRKPGAQAALGYLAFILFLMGTMPGCTLLRVDLLDSRQKPLQERVIQGKGSHKVALIALQGAIRNSANKPGLGHEGGAVPEIAAQLNRIAEDDNVKAVVLKINSPGGTITASEQLYHEIKRFKSRTRLPLVAMLMDVAASGGYYAALPADEILAHPTTITGSVGVIYLQPKVQGLLDKLGVEMEVTKSGEQKDMGSLFRATDPQEARLIERMISQLAERFMGAVTYHRPDTEQWRSEIVTARIFLGSEALEFGLIDGLGYLTDGIARAQALAELPEDAKIVSYGRRPTADPTLYHSSQAQPGRVALDLLNPLVPLGMAGLTPGFHYLWLRGY